MKKICTILALYATVIASAQSSSIVFDHYGLEDGFNSAEAMDITTTPNGLVWITSNDGLARYDGKRFKFHQHIPGDTNSLLINYCTNIESDKRGWLWINSDENLEVFNPQTEKFNHVKLINNEKEKLKVKPISFYYDNIADIMWISTKTGLYYSKGGSLELQSAGSFTKDKLVKETECFILTSDGNRMLWLASENNICKLDLQNGNATWINIGINKFGIIISGYLDSSKVLWLGTSSLGLVEYNTINHVVKNYFYRNPEKEENIIVAVTKIKGYDDLLWLSTAGFGFTAFNIKTHQFTSYQSKFNNDKHGIRGNAYGLFNDKNNTMWIGSSAGLHKFDENKQLFKTIDLSGIANGITMLPVSMMAMQQSESGEDEIVWFFIPYKGGYQYSLKQQKILPLPPKLAKYFGPSAAVLNIFVDQKNILWISNVDFGLIAYDIVADKIIVNEKKYFYENKKWANCFFSDKKNNFWIGTFNGLYMLPAGQTEIKEVISVNKKLEENGISKMIQGVCQDKTGAIWFTADNSNKFKACIAKYICEADRVYITYNEKNDLNVAETGVDIRGIVCNTKGDLFVNFYGSGVATFNPAVQNSNIKHLAKAEGLNRAYIDDLQSDAKGNIWCSNSLGLSCYKPDKKLFVNYNYTAYGIENTISAPIYISSNSQNLYIGQHNAIRYGNTNADGLTLSKSNLLFTDFSIFNKPYENNSTELDHNRVIYLKYNQNMISVQFALLSYTNSSDNTYSWMLKGLEKDWTISKNNIASYTNLKPGSYTLLVKAANSQGEWLVTSKQLTIIINPPFYKTWWFVLLCILTIVAIVYWLVQQRINRIKARYQLRNKIATDLHDEIGSTLTSISILSNVSQQAMVEQPQQAKEMLQQISAQSRNIQQSMSDIVWSIRPDNEKIENLVVRMREYAAQTLEPLNINITIDADESLVNKVLPMECRKDVLLIYKEAINNIAKHAGASIVNVSISNGNKKIQLAIQDNGSWKGSNSGTGTKSMKDRATANGGSLLILPTEKGTKVIATIPIP